MAEKTVLDPVKSSPEVREFEEGLKKRVVGQDRAIRRMGRIYGVYLAGLAPPGRPIANILLLGPTGSGKTRLAEAVAESLYDDIGALLKVDCAELQHSHEIAKLLGSPPGYLGHRETQPLITQEKLEEHFTGKTKLSLVLFDEIEKSSDALWQLLLGILDKATLTLGDNRRVDFGRSIIFMTSNLGTHEITTLVDGGIGFVGKATRKEDDLDQRIYRIAMQAARRKFPPEFMNRVDKAIVFRPLGQEQLEQILDIELRYVQQRILNYAATESVFIFQCTQAAREFLLAEGTDKKYGARHLKRAIERHLVFPFSNLLVTRQVKIGDIVKVNFDKEKKRLVFSRKKGGALTGRKNKNGPPREKRVITGYGGAKAAADAEEKKKAATAANGGKDNDKNGNTNNEGC